MLEKLNLSDVRAFVYVAEAGSFTQAAEDLQASRSHLSKQLSSLEAELGVSLMVRSTRSLKLTDAGKLFFAQAQHALAQLEQAAIAAQDNTQQMRGLIRINSVGGPMGEDYVAHYASHFMQRYPDIEIELDFSSHRVDLIRDEFDIAFRMGALDDASFVARKLCDLEFETLASPEFLERYPDLEHPKDLKDVPCLTGSVGHWKFENVHKPEQRYEVSVQGRFKCKNGRALVGSACADNGIIRVPVRYCEPQIQQGLLVPVFKNWRIAAVPFYAIYHKDKYQSARLREFIRFVLAEFEGL